MDGVIGGLTTALVMGGNPADLKGLQVAVDKGAAGLKEVCDAAVKLTAAAGTKGVAEEIAKGAIEPLADLIKSAAGALWTRHVEKDKLELETIKTQLEAAKWPAFGEILAGPNGWQEELRSSLSNRVQSRWQAARGRLRFQ
jgi:hypothetical protein